MHLLHVKNYANNLKKIGVEYEKMKAEQTPLVHSVIYLTTMMSPYQFLASKFLKWGAATCREKGIIIPNMRLL